MEMWKRPRAWASTFNTSLRPGFGGAVALWSCCSESLPVKHLRLGVGLERRVHRRVHGRHMILHPPHPPDPRNPTHPLLLHPHSSLLTHTGRIRDITEDLNYLTVQVLSPSSDIACFCLCSPMSVAVTVCTMVFYLFCYSWKCMLGHVIGLSICFK